MTIGTIRYRLTNDFQLAIITLMGVIALLGISPFALRRALHGQWPAFALDLLIEVGILTSVLHAWRSGSTRGASLFLAYFIGSMAVAAVLLLGLGGEYWFYPAIVANFFLVDRRHALAIALFGLLLVMLDGNVPRNAANFASFFVTVIVCALFSYIFSYRTMVQRQQLETLASKDALTGLFNRRTLADELERARLMFEREKRVFGILMMDLDHFKEVNDRHGHLAGDHTLTRLARLLESEVRPDDRVFRFGGEEFVILAAGASRTALTLMAEKLRRKVAGDFGMPGSPSVTISIGGATQRAGESIDDWLARADAALYAAKGAGRNRVVVDPDDSARGQD